MSEEIGAQVPEWAGELPAIPKHGVEGNNKFINLDRSDHERREYFERIKPVGSHLRKDPVAG